MRAGACGRMHLHAGACSCMRAHASACGCGACACSPEGSLLITPEELLRSTILRPAVVPFFTVGARPKRPAARERPVMVTMI